VTRESIKKILLLTTIAALASCMDESQTVDVPSPAVEVEVRLEQARPTPLYSSVYFQNVSSEPVPQIVATDGEKIYRIGSVTAQELLGDIIKNDPIRDIYDYLSPAVEHKCSNGSYFRSEFLKETILDRLYSYSFGCCSDVNEPMLSSLYLAAGYEGHSFRSRHHVAIEVCESPGGVCHYADVDLDMFYEGGIDVARALNGGVAFWFEDSKVYKENGQLRPLAAEGEAIPPTVFNLNPGDYIGFTKDPVEDPVLRVYGDEIPSAPPSTKVGIARIFTAPYEVGRTGDCISYRIRFPYVLLSAAIYDQGSNIPLDVPAHGLYELEFEICGEPGATVDTAKRKLLLHFQYNSNIFPDIDRLSASGIAGGIAVAKY
jgi:hypothetical protein